MSSTAVLVKVRNQVSLLLFVYSSNNEAVGIAVYNRRVIMNELDWRDWVKPHKAQLWQSVCDKWWPGISRMEGTVGTKPNARANSLSELHVTFSRCQVFSVNTMWTTCDLGPSSLDNIWKNSKSKVSKAIPVTGRGGLGKITQNASTYLTTQLSSVKRKLEIILKQWRQNTFHTTNWKTRHISSLLSMS
jgi:hypothetical protein